MIARIASVALAVGSIAACVAATASAPRDHDEAGYQETFSSFLALCRSGNRFGHLRDQACHSVTEAADRTGECSAPNEAAVAAARADPASRGLRRCLIRCDSRYASESPESDNCGCVAECFGPLATETLAALNQELACKLEVEGRTAACR